MDNDKFIEVGEFSQELSNVIGSSLPLQKIYRSKGLPSHLVKKKHFNCLKHIDDIPKIIKSPDYIGINPNENGSSVELIKKFGKNVLVGIKFNHAGNYLYVSTMHDVQESKLERRLHSGRIKKINIDEDF